MRDHVDDEIFIKKRALEMKLEQTYPNYFSKYSLVTFKDDISYRDAMVKGRKQDELLKDIVSRDANPDLDKVLQEVQKITA
jgi:kynurenine 3-monooxygenase